MSFEEYAAARLPAMLRCAAVLTGDRHLAEDLVQDGLIRAQGGGGGSSPAARRTGTSSG